MKKKIQKKFPEILQPLKMSKIRKQRRDAPFAKGEESWIILEYGAV